MSETEAISLVQAGGSDDAWSFLFNIHQKFIFNRCNEILKQPDEAEDMTQEVFMHLLGRIKSFRGQSDFRTWLYNLTTNKVLDHLRAKSRRIQPEVLNGQEVYELPDQLERLEYCEIMSRLSPGKQRLVQGRAAGHTYCEMGSKCVVSRRMKKVDKLLRERLA